MKHILFIITIFFAINTYSQDLKYRKGIGMEVGFGHNECYMEEKSSNYPGTDNRDALYITPTFRLTYQFGLLKRIPIFTFSGLTINGGKSKEESNGYQSKISILSLEIGVIPLYYIKDFSFGIGIKYNRIGLAYADNYGSLLGAKDDERSWESVSWLGNMNENCWDWGIRSSYQYKKISLTIESWRSINNFAEESIKDNVTYRQKNIRMLVGIIF